MSYPGEVGMSSWAVSNTSIRGASSPRQMCVPAGISKKRDTKPTAEITRDILGRTLKVCPEIAPPEIRTEREPTVDDIISLIVEENVGFRPTNPVSNCRLEVELREGSKGRPKIPIVYNYG